MYTVRRQPRERGARRARLAVLALVVVALVLAASDARAATSQHARVEGTNPNLGQRLILMERWTKAHGGRLPQSVIIGSSRSTFYDPRQVTQLTGATSFNAGISDGGAGAMRAMVDWLALRSRGELPRLIVFADLETFDARTVQVRTRIWQTRMTRQLDACADDPSVACRAAGARLARELANEATRRQGGAPGWNRFQRADGRQIGGNLAQAAAKGADMDALRRRRIAIRVTTYGRDGFHRVEPAAVAHFDHLLRTANDAGVQPLVVITPTHPACIRVCGRAGWTARRREVRAQLAKYARARDMVWVDFSNPASYRGTGAEFYDDIHLRPAGAAMVMRELDRRGLLDRAVAPRAVASQSRVPITDSVRAIVRVFA